MSDTVIRFMDGSIVPQSYLDRLQGWIDGACESDPGEEGEIAAIRIESDEESSRG